MSESNELANRILALRARGVSRQRIGELASLGTGAKIVRIERGGVHPHEVAQLGDALARLETEYGIVRTQTAATGPVVDREDQRSARWPDEAQRDAAARKGTTCRLCDVWWTGDNTCHCSICHYTFTTVNLFDMHRVGEPGNRTCRHPSELRDHDMPLRQIERGGALAWSYPVDEDAAVRLRSLAAGTYQPGTDD